MYKKGQVVAVQQDGGYEPMVLLEIGSENSTVHYMLVDGYGHFLVKSASDTEILCIRAVETGERYTGYHEYNHDLDDLHQNKQLKEQVRQDAMIEIGSVEHWLNEGLLSIGLPSESSTQEQETASHEQYEYQAVPG